eukprot:13833023-Alexandrium_andersonii.AAC.1
MALALRRGRRLGIVTGPWPLGEGRLCLAGVGLDLALVGAQQLKGHLEEVRARVFAVHLCLE